MDKTRREDAMLSGKSRAIDWPFSPSHFPFFYGWVVVAVSTIGIVMSVPGQTMGVSVFTDHLLGALDINRIRLSEAYMYGTIGSSLFLPLAGRFYDRLGARVLVVAASIGLGSTLLCLSRCDVAALWIQTLLVSDEHLPAVQMVVLTACFFCVRFWGQGVLTLASRNMLGKWFRRKRGLAAGISGAVVSASFSMAPQALAAIIAIHGWRGAWVFLSITVGVGMTLIGCIFFRDNPEQCGLQMDGDSPESRAETVDDRPEGRDFTLAEALGTYSFWLTNLALCIPALIGTAFTFHIEDIGRKAGLIGDEALAIFPYMAIFSILTNFSTGWLSDRVRIRYIVGTLVMMQALGCAGWLHFHTIWGRGLVAIGFGVSWGLFALLTAVIWPRFFGRAHLGRISSVNMSSLVFASAIGPWLFALIDDATGTYAWAVGISCTAALVAMVASLRLENPQRETPSEA